MPNTKFSKQSSIFKFYPGGHRFVKQAHVWRYVFASQFVGEKIVLDLGCGYGYGADFLLQSGAKQVVGLDFESKRLTLAKRDYPGIYFIQGNAIRLPFSDDSFDIVIMFEVIEHIASQDILISEIKRVVRPNGLLICSTPHKRYTCGTNPDHIKELEPLEFFSLLEKFGRVKRYAQYMSMAEKKEEERQSQKKKILMTVYKLLPFPPQRAYLKKKVMNLLGKDVKLRPPPKINGIILKHLDKRYRVKQYVENSQEIPRILLAVCYKESRK